MPGAYLGYDLAPLVGGLVGHRPPVAALKEKRLRDQPTSLAERAKAYPEVPVFKADAQVSRETASDVPIAPAEHGRRGYVVVAQQPMQVEGLGAPDTLFVA